MAESARDPLSMDTVGRRGRWLAPAWPGLRSAPSSGQASEETGFQENAALACHSTTNSVDSLPFRPAPPRLRYPRRPSPCPPPTSGSPSTMEATRSQMQAPSCS